MRELGKRELGEGRKTEQGRKEVEKWETAQEEGKERMGWGG